jgi:hypothetical protein
VELRDRNLARVNLLIQENLEDDDGSPEGLDERTADYLKNMTDKVKSNLPTLTRMKQMERVHACDDLAPI